MIKNSTLKVLWHWVTMGPYHFARMRALAGIPGIELTVVETTSLDDHAWTRQKEAEGLAVVTLSSAPLSPKTLTGTRAAFARMIDQCRPDLIIGSGYAELSVLRTILGYRNANPSSLALLWSESTALDHPRVAIKEAVKSFCLSVFDGALVAGSQHAQYLEQLGMPMENIAVAGNCVDNEFFSVRVDAIRAGSRLTSVNVPLDYFLFVGRLLPEKNVSTLIEAYTLYRRLAGSAAWDLVLVGSGPEAPALRTQVNNDNVKGVWFVGNRQIGELPYYYAKARCLVLPSISEPWGLVVNEAMAAGLPVLVSRRCGCAADLVRHEVNGYIFDPRDVHALASLLLKMSSGAVPLARFGAIGRKIVEGYTPQLFARRVVDHFRSLLRRSVQRPRNQLLTHVTLQGVGVMEALKERLS
jgi:1,2-diacylglycerol 3-alpha-glucosyltransferase